jgi:hypothetical protein
VHRAPFEQFFLAHRPAMGSTAECHFLGWLREKRRGEVSSETAGFPASRLPMCLRIAYLFPESSEVRRY